MSESPVNKSRRRFLTLSTAVVGGVGVAAVSIPFIKSWQPTSRVVSLGKPIEVDLSHLESGQMMTVEWRGKPIWIVRRPEDVVSRLKEHDHLLIDPDSEVAQQPRYAQNFYRSLKPEYFVAIGVCTHLGCSPKYLPESLNNHIPGVKEGFFCPCHGSCFDMAGRVFSGGPAPLNLVVPDYQFITDSKIVIGDDKGEV
ncbi:ubiquinol-cytochrome c reductase iron-sulfur subunit [Vibrio sp.]|uniref:Ubiquinol-cytochrome c reductase iron-sulfur subunit n=1 Tax=Vibrio viridaestus TaxID=2487322 RepID=A0A3N9U0X7_9VIBR|nr:ubiquinol-cytochrome c reductase iron-sulfur subunit [Vibrio viridaestus]MDC0609265.1 ubiquinol-cytochrome c reductase iron-sulfur subunit [Vibrio sp.]RQW62952.1 ubiquinol-cytochrome c reductase iron-sulfur subunit [Vibrio viridaestus]